MGSNYYGDQGTRNEGGGLSSSSSSSSRKGKKNGSDKPKQPQRGLGVAQLEKIRLHSQLGCNYLPSSVHNPYPPSFGQEDMRLQTAYTSPAPASSSFSYSSPSSTAYGYGPHGVMMGLQDLDRTNIRYGDAQSSIPRWHQGNPSQHYAEPIMTRPFFEPTVENQNKRDRNDSMAQNSESRSSEEIDLELRLSL